MDLKGYQQYKEQSIATMTQEELLLLLYAELVKRLMQAELALDKKEYPLFEASVQRGIEIIDYLDSTLDRKYEISHNLGRLYEYFDYELGRACAGAGASAGGASQWGRGSGEGRRETGRAGGGQRTAAQAACGA